MKKYIIQLAPALLLALVLALGLRAEEKTKEKSTKMAAEKAPKEMAYTATCTPPCEFSVKTHDKDEAAAIIKEHARTHHQIEMSDKDVDEVIKAHAIRKPKETKE